MIASLLLLAASSQDIPVEPTWSNGIGELVYANCSECHRPGQAAPFSLLSYESARRRAPMLAEVVEGRFMPPWQPMPGHGSFRGERRMSAEDIASFVAWADGGAPEGNPEQAPLAPSFDDGWALGTPDLVVRMTEGFAVPADGPDIYHNFVVPLELKEEVWVDAIEVRPGAPRVLHHVLFSVDAARRGRILDERDEGPGFRGVDEGDLTRSRGLGDGVAATGLDGVGLGGWAVGGQPYRLPLGLARRIPVGADLVLRSHFHPSGQAETELTTLGLYFTKEAPKRSLHALQLPPEFGGYEGLRMEPGESGVFLQDSLTLPVDTLALSVGGHAHFLAESMQLWATPPDSPRRSLFRIDDWDFDWQQRYLYAEPVFLPAGTRIGARVTYDNSEANPDNPFSPPRKVRWGLQSTDEMGSVTLALVASDEDQAPELAKALARHHYRRGRGLTLRPKLAQKLWDERATGDSIVIADLPKNWGGVAAFSDLDGNGLLDREELGLGPDSAPGFVPPGAADVLGELAMGASSLVAERAGAESMKPFAVESGRWRVLIFTTADCPVAAAYGPEIERLAEDFQSAPLEILRVWVGELDSQPAAGLLDPELRLAKAAGVTRTPEAVLLGPGGELLYRGRIDDRFTALGSRRQEPGRRDLRLAIEACLAERPVEQALTEVVGCLLPVVQPGR